MDTNSLTIAIEAIKKNWGPLNDEMITNTRQNLVKLLKTSFTEEWLETLHKELPPHKELYRDPVNEFILLAHAESEGLYRPPHDHGKGWVIYAVQHGEIEMGTYIRVAQEDGKFQLMRKETTLVRAGETKVYLPGEIHDTRCMTDKALLFRFTSRDLKKIEHGHQVKRYSIRDGIWSDGTV